MARHFKHILVLTLLFATQTGAVAQESSYRELQAIYMYSFAKYTSWPEKFDAFIIGVIDDKVMHEVISNKLSDKTMKGRPIKVKLVNTVEEAGSCHLIYLNHRHSKSLADVIKNAQGQNTLIVTENDLIKKGAMISFLVIGNKLRFKINHEALNNEKLVASEGLLSLALN